MKFDDSKSKELLGGSIDPTKVKIEDVEARSPYLGLTPQEQFHRTLQRVAQDETADRSTLPAMRDDLLDYRPLNETPYYELDYWYERFPEQMINKNAPGMFTGKGGRHDSHHLQNLFYDTFHQHPELVGAYSRGIVL